MTQDAFEALPLAPFRDEILGAISSQKNLLLTAPTGSGKSTFIPWMLSRKTSERPLRVAVLEPRRLAATSLSRYLARISGEELGKAVGYRIRFESAASSDTKILYTTYGNFLQSTLHGNERFDWIILDEFHERRAEMDLLLAYFLAKGNEASSPRIAVLSADLNREELEKILQVKCLEVGRPGFPVETLNQDVPKGSPLGKNVEKALRTLERNGILGTTLVFLPGKGEISSVHRHLDEAFGYGKRKILELYGGQNRETEREIFLETDEPRIILSTNIAETSLTIPSVTGVIDSGLERTTEFSPGEDRNILRLARISLQNAVQRTGRAGRTQKGVCIRLWSKREEALFPKAIVPEIQKADLRPILLKKAALEKLSGGKKLSLPTEPETSLEKKALKALVQYGFLSEDGSITSRGESALQIPLNALELARAFLEANALSMLSLATLAILDSDAPARKSGEPRNVLEAAREMLREKSGADRETVLAFRRVRDFARERSGKELSPGNQEETVRLFLKAFPEALAIQSGNSYKAPSGTFSIPEASKKGARAVLVFHILRTNSSARSETHAGFYLEVPEEFLPKENAEVRYELLWRSGQERYIGLEICTGGGIEISRREVLPQEASPEVLTRLRELTGKTWMERHLREDLSHLWMDDANKVLLCKMKLAAENFPEYSLPKWDEDDMNLVVEDFLFGHFLMRELTPELFRSKMKEYFGENMIGWLEKMFPDSMLLPNGKRARYHYAEGSPVELSARIEDFMTLRGEHVIAAGKVKVRYDILAPNFRTAQKTWDLTGFWQNTYPQIRKELRGRYPKHPWPETVV